MTVRRSRVEIDPKLRRLLQRLDRDIADPVREAINVSAIDLMEEAQTRVPIDTGDLAMSIGIRTGSGGLSAEVGFSHKMRAKWRKAGWRARFTEYGTQGYQVGERRTKGIIRRQAVPARPARPFLRPAFVALRDSILERQRRAVMAALAKAVGS